MIASNDFREQIGTVRSLYVAGLRLDVKSIDDIIIKDFEPQFHDFSRPTVDEAESVNLLMHRQLTNPFRLEDFETVFHSGQAWSLFRSNMTYLLTINGENERPSCVAAFDKACSSVNIYCEDFLLQESRDGVLTIANPFFYPLDRLMLMYILSQRQGVMFHAAGIEINGKGLLFPGKSGAGKSTLSKLFMSGMGPVVLSDERVIVRETNLKTRLYGTPWPGDAGIAVNRCSPLSGIFFIRHGNKCAIRELKPNEVLLRLLPLATIPWYDAEVMSDILSFCEYLVYGFPAFDVSFTLDNEIVHILGDFSQKL